MKTRYPKILIALGLVLITFLVVTPSLYAKALNAKSQGNWVSFQIDLTEKTGLDKVGAEDVTLHYGNHSIKAEKIRPIGNKHKTARLLVKFDRAELINLLQGSTGDVTLTAKVKGVTTKDFVIKVTGFCTDDPASTDNMAPKIQSAVIDSYALTLTYNEILDEESVPDEDDFSVYVSKQLLEEVSHVNVDGKKVILLLPERVREGTAVKISYTPGNNPICDLAGNPAAEFDSLKVSKNHSPSDSPDILSTNPKDQADGIAVNSHIRMFFHEDIQAGFKISSITIKDEKGIFWDQHDYAYSIQDNLLVLNPDDDFKCYTKYTVKIPAGAVKDLDGNLNTETWSFSFTTGGPA